ncbi:hypothetical protein MXD81_26325, partial [Microbacteriaceae bacterium K1510]|nr:hypothetical protein [Microbacteriaceae bacterium K1510]
HEAEVARFIDCLRNGRVGRDQLEARSKLAGTETGLMKALSARGAPVEDVEVLAFGVFVGRLWCELEVRANDVGRLHQDG